VAIKRVSACSGVQTFTSARVGARSRCAVARVADDQGRETQRKPRPRTPTYTPTSTNSGGHGGTTRDENLRPHQDFWHQCVNGFRLWNKRLRDRAPLGTPGNAHSHAENEMRAGETPALLLSISTRCPRILNLSVHRSGGIWHGSLIICPSLTALHLLLNWSWVTWTAMSGWRYELTRRGDCKPP
jgi:hypothetical protein